MKLQLKMRERKLYDPLGKWLITNKDCQKENFFQGYCKEPLIGETRPDVVGVRYVRGPI